MRCRNGFCCRSLAKHITKIFAVLTVDFGNDTHATLRLMGCFALCSSNFLVGCFQFLLLFLQLFAYICAFVQMLIEVFNLRREFLFFLLQLCGTVCRILLLDGCLMQTEEQIADRAFCSRETRFCILQGFCYIVNTLCEILPGINCIIDGSPESNKDVRFHRGVHFFPCLCQPLGHFCHTKQGYANLIETSKKCNTHVLKPPCDY